MKKLNEMGTTLLIASKQPTFQVSIFFVSGNKYILFSKIVIKPEYHNKYSLTKIGEQKVENDWLLPKEGDYQIYDMCYSLTIDKDIYFVPTNHAIIQACYFTRLQRKNLRVWRNSKLFIIFNTQSPIITCVR